MYRISALAAGATPVEVREAERRTDVDAILAACSERTALVFVANPNNPTGTMIAEAEVARLAAGLPPQALLVLDGAYAEFVGGFDGHAGLVEARDNVVMTRTFSKIHGLGGLRVGWGYGPAHVIEVLNRVRGPFNLSTAGARRRRGGGARHRLDRALLRGEPPQPRAGCGRARGGRRAVRPVAGQLRARALPRPRPRRRPATGRCATPASSCAGSRATSCREALRITVGDAEACARVAEAVGAVHEGAGVIALPPRRADRARADRLVDQPRDPPQRRAGADHRLRPHGRDPRRGGAARARRGLRRPPPRRSRAPTSSSSACRSGRWPRSPPRSGRGWRPARRSPTSARSSAR